MNTAMLHKAVTSQVHNVGVLSNTGGDSNSGEWLRNSTFHTLTQVAVGARVMLTCNGGAVAPGSVNGSCGTVVGLEYGPVPDKYKYPGQSATALMTVLVRMDDTGQVQAIRRTKYGSLFVTERHVFCKATFPLQLAYAITGHKSQGATLNGTTIIDINSTFCPGLLYVMLSRVTEREQIRLLQRLTPEMFTPMDIPF
jgi:ATP-dependent DNA helicase PIF1